MSRALRNLREGLVEFACRVILASILCGLALIVLVMYVDYLFFEEV